MPIDLAAKVKGIPEQESRREHLTLDELNMLAQTPCDNPIIKRAALFSALTGIRHVDIKKMKWREIVKEGDHYRINFTQQKTKGVEYTPISAQAYQLCGERLDDNRLVFEGLPDHSWISKPLERWVKAAGITKHITFHEGSYLQFSFLLKTKDLQKVAVRLLTIWKRAKFHIFHLLALNQKNAFLYCKVNSNFSKLQNNTLKNKEEYPKI